ncbi:MAG TPA: SIMPL domain-containing protein [Patescibacteria group bacterium]|nr:SIMPL domain-containing protein [Patescibacteria group bacterium]
MPEHHNEKIGAIFFLGIVAFVFLWVINFFNISLPLSVTNRSVSGELAVVGSGSVDVVPNNASVQVGIVVSNADSAKAAEQGVNTINNKIISSLEAIGIKKADIKTTNYSINPNYNYDNGKNTINGYSGNANVTIKVKDTNNLSKVIEAATEAGANQVLDTQYNVEDPNKYRQEARDKAISNAKEQAQQLANQLGIKLGKIVNIVESTPDSGGPVPMYAQKDVAVGLGGGNVAPVLQPGSQTITSTVTLYFDKR